MILLSESKTLKSSLPRVNTSFRIYKVSCDKLSVLAFAANLKHEGYLKAVSKSLTSRLYLILKHIFKIRIPIILYFNQFHIRIEDPNPTLINCGGNALNVSSGRVTYPYSGNYPDNVVCTWLIYSSPQTTTVCRNGVQYIIYLNNF